MRKWKVPALLLAVMLLLTGCAPKDAGLAILIGLDKTELAQGDLPCRSYYEGETLMGRCARWQRHWDIPPNGIAQAKRR